MPIFQSLAYLCYTLGYLGISAALNMSHLNAKHISSCNMINTPERSLESQRGQVGRLEYQLVGSCRRPTRQAEDLFRNRTQLTNDGSA